MNAREGSDLPPLRSWAYAGVALAVALSVLAVLVLTSHWRVDADARPSPNAFSRHNLERLEAMTRKDGGPLVVLLGNSKLKYATGDSLQEPGDATADSGTPLRPLRIVADRAVFENFSGIAGDVLDARPALIVLQASLLVQDRVTESDYRHLQAYVRWRLFSPGSEFEPNGTDPQAMQLETPCTGDFSAATLGARLRRLERGVRHGLELASPRAAWAFVDEARRLGIPVAVLSLPNHPRLEAEIASPDLARQLSDATGARQLPLWHPPASVGENETRFCDFVHLHESVREEISTWLLARAREAIELSSRDAR